MERVEKNYLVHIRLGAAKPTRTRVQQSVPIIKSILERLSRKNYQLAYTSQDGGTFGFLVRTNANAGIILAQLDSPGKEPFTAFDESTPRQIPPMLNDDSILIVEVGEDFNDRGYGRASTWLQHR